ncbi:MAG: ribose-5-phosphate isomerase RpiA [Methyloligellaceae bacterium]
MDTDAQKLQAAERALDYVEPGMKLGLGSGSTAAKFVDLVGARVKEGLDLLCVPTSEGTRVQAEALGIPLTTLDEVPHLDLTVDGADELDSQLRLIKGGGGALLREKIVASASDRMIVIADAGKHVEKLGRFALPVEVERFGLRATWALVEARARLAGCGGEIKLRENRYGDPFLTDGANYILDCSFEPIPEPAVLAVALASVPGVVEHGLFIGIATTAVVAGPDGVEILGKA